MKNIILFLKTKNLNKILTNFTQEYLFSALLTLSNVDYIDISTKKINKIKKNILHHTNKIKYINYEFFKYYEKCDLLFFHIMSYYYNNDNYLNKILYFANKVLINDKFLIVVYNKETIYHNNFEQILSERKNKSSFYILLKKRNYNNNNNNLKLSFSNMYLLYNESNNNGWNNNENGRFSWDDTYVVNSCLKLHTITTDNYYLEIANNLLNKFIKNTDYENNIIDPFFAENISGSNISYRIWSATRYTKYQLESYNKQFNTNLNTNVYHCDLVLGSNICHSILSFSNYIIENNLSHVFVIDEYLKICKDYINNLIKYHWIDENEEEGYFYDNFIIYWAKCRGINNYSPNVMPFNRYAITGRCLILLYKIEKQEVYLSYITKIYNKIMNHMINHEKSDNNIYIWNYAPNLNNYIEDISHATLTIDLLLDCYHNNLTNIKIDDIIKLKNLFFCIVKDNKVYNNIDGKEGNAKLTNHMEALSRWLPLNAFCQENEIYNFVEKYFLERKNINYKKYFDIFNDNKEIYNYYHLGAYYIQYFTNLLYYNKESPYKFI